MIAPPAASKQSAPGTAAAALGICIMCPLLLLMMVWPFLDAPPAEEVVPFSFVGASIYFVMVDRFARDPEVEEAAASISATGGCSGDRWCGGTLRGLTAKLDYIQGMGFDAVWITPVVKQLDGQNCFIDWCGTGYAGYWTQDFSSLDSRYGTPDDLIALSAALHERGMKLVMDVVVNHVRPVASAADIATVMPFDRVEYYHTLNRPSGESFDDWVGSHITTVPDCNIGTYDCPGYTEERALSGWFFNLADLNQNHPFVRRKLLDWISNLVATYSIDALRLDTAPFVPRDFLEDFRVAAGVPILGENTASNQSFVDGFLTGRRDKPAPLDTTTNFPMFVATFQAFCGRRKELDWGISGAGGGDDGDEAGCTNCVNSVHEGEEGTLAALGATLQSHLKREAEHGVDLGHYTHFVDTHDEPRIAVRCGYCASRVRNALTYTMLMRGTSWVTYGTEQGFDYTDQRTAMWSRGMYDTATPLYMLIRALNRIRKEYVRPEASVELIHATPDTLIFTRGGSGGGASGGSGGDGDGGGDASGDEADDDAVWVLVNNDLTDPQRPFVGNRPVGLYHHAYCAPGRLVPPPLREGRMWVNLLHDPRTEVKAGQGGCLHAWDVEPKVLVAIDRPKKFKF